MLILVGKVVQLPLTPELVELVQFSVAPPAVPKTENVTVQAPAVVEFHVSEPEKLVAVVAPETLPIACEVAHVPDTELPAWVRSITKARVFSKTNWGQGQGPPGTSEACNVPDHSPATFAGAGGVGAVGVPLPPHADAEIRSRTRQPPLSIGISLGSDRKTLHDRTTEKIARPRLGRGRRQGRRQTRL